MEKKEYWFALYPNTFLWVKDKEGLVYNSENGTKIKFINKGMIEHVTKTLLKINNLYCTLLDQESLEDKELDAWIHEIIDSNAGVLTPKDGSNQHPLTLMPILKVQDDVKYYQWEHNQGIDGEIMENLHQLVFFINGSKYGNDLYNKQILYPTTSQQTLEEKDICWFATNAVHSPLLSQIGLVGNLFVYPYLQKVTEYLQTISSVSAYVILQDVMDNLTKAELLANKVNLHILVTDYIALTSLLKEEWTKKVTFIFIISSELDYDTAVWYKEEKKLRHAEIVPVYTGKNKKFLEELLFIDEDDVQNIILSKREIFIRQTLNIVDFGNLFIMPDGNVYSNRNATSIGSLKEPPHTIVYREMTEGNSWLHIRNEKPCCDCIYQWLCPSPSNLELVIGKPNLCLIKT